MKIRPRHYFSTLWDALAGQHIKHILVKSRYVLELGGSGGYKITGTNGYWGRYGTPEKIVELASNLEGENDCISYNLPSALHNRKYSHRVVIWGTKSNKHLLVEFNFSGDQCGSYEKQVSKSELLKEINTLQEAQSNILGYGYKYVEY